MLVKDLVWELQAARKNSSLYKCEILQVKTSMSELQVVEKAIVADLRPKKLQYWCKLKFVKRPCKLNI